MHSNLLYKEEYIFLICFYQSCTCFLFMPDGFVLSSPHKNVKCFPYVINQVHIKEYSRYPCDRMQIYIHLT